MFTRRFCKIPLSHRDWQRTISWKPATLMSCAKHKTSSMSPGGYRLQRGGTLHPAYMCVSGKARVKGCCKCNPVYDITGGSSVPQNPRNGFIIWLHHLKKKEIFPNFTVLVEVFINWIFSVQGISANHVLSSHVYWTLQINALRLQVRPGTLLVWNLWGRMCEATGTTHGGKEITSDEM